VRTIIDLRPPTDAASNPPVPTTGQVRFLAVPLFETVPISDDAASWSAPATLSAAYRLVLDERQEPLRAALAALAAPGALPAFVHCSVGKDRTGVVVALALAAVGVPRATIAEDYVLSGQYLADYFAALRQQLAGRSEAWARIEPMLACTPDIILDALAYLDGLYGSIERYLLAIGLSTAELAALREALTEPTPT
jgi:protein-tyrosine phosphatase